MMQADDDGAHMRVWAILQMLVGPGRALTDETENTLYVALAQARLMNAKIAYDAGFVRRISATALGAAYPRFADERRPVMAPRLSICEPIGGLVPRTYGSPLLSPDEAAAQRAPIERSQAGKRGLGR